MDDDRDARSTGTIATEGGASWSLRPTTDRAPAHALAHFGDLTDGSALLDLGCGTGDYSVLFSSRGATSSPSTAARSRSRRCRGLRDGGIEGIEPVAADAFDIDRLGTFDCVFGKFILHHLEPFPDFVARLRAATRDGGSATSTRTTDAAACCCGPARTSWGEYGIPQFGDRRGVPDHAGRDRGAARSTSTSTIDVAETYLVRLGAQYLLRSRLMGPARRPTASLLPAAAPARAATPTARTWLLRSPAR